MARILSYPFRLQTNGEAATVEQGSDEANAEQLAVLVLTRIGERALVPSYGVEDPAFGALTLGDVVAGVAMFGPDVQIESVETSYPTETAQEVDIAFA